MAKYLPLGTRLPQREGRPLTLFDLATHTSGLPFMPGELLESTPKHYSAEFYQFLAQHNPPEHTRWDYSNLGYWLLSETLALRAGMGYQNLLRTRILIPLGMTHTAVTLSPKMRADLAIGHNVVLQPSMSLGSLPPYGGMAAAEGLVSTANGISTFLSVTMGYDHSPLNAGWLPC